MGALGSKLRRLEGGRVMFWCPGCDGAHQIRVEVDVPNGQGPVWGFNGDGDKPTFTPSINLTYNGADAGVNGAPQSVCHSLVIDGRIQFLADCTHGLAGHTVDLPNWCDDDA